MKKIYITFTFLLLFFTSFSQSRIRSISSKSTPKKITEEYKEIEAENFFSQTFTKDFKWYKFSKGIKKKIKNDDDKPHFKDCSNNSYIEILPTKKVDKNIKGGYNFFPIPGKTAIVKYKVKFNSIGRYYVWVKGYSSHEHDNSIHVGIDDKWPDSGKALYWCDNKEKWSWAGKQRVNSDFCSDKSKRIYIDVRWVGVHNVQFSMREFGLEFDKFVLTKIESKIPK